MNKKAFQEEGENVKKKKTGNMNTWVLHLLKFFAFKISDVEK